MNKITGIIITVLIIVSCSNNSNVDNTEKTPKVQVKVTSVTEGSLSDYLSLTGKTIYYNKNTIVAPISGYVTKVNVQQGDHVSKNTVIFEIQTKESYAMQKDDSLAKEYGKIKITVPSNGIVTALNVVQKDVYIDRGSAMCIIVGSNDLKVIVDVPFEFGRYAKIGNQCTVVLPDSTNIQAVFTKVLPQMNEQTQTMKVQANLNTKNFIPENMIVKVLIEKGKTQKTQILPKNCVMTDALMTKYWVMKLINDSVAIQTPVKVSKQTHSQVEILEPEFTTSDRIISEGAYGLGDTVLVEIEK